MTVYDYQVSMIGIVYVLTRTRAVATRLAQFRCTLDLGNTLVKAEGC